MAGLNIYEMYNEWFDVIAKECDDSHFQNEVKTGQYMGYLYYVLDNGLNVYLKKENGDMRIFEDDPESKNIHFDRKSAYEGIAMQIGNVAAILYFSKANASSCSY